MTIVNREQFEHWNAEADMWVKHPERIDAMLGVFDEPVLDAARIAPGHRVLDVGCGTGATTVAAARRVMPGGVAHGIDLSEAMVAEARRRAEAEGVPAVFAQGDAQVHPFDGRYDAVISRFGVMFFDDPSAAFANLARVTRAGGRLAFVSWQPLIAQQWMLVLGAAVMPHLAAPPAVGGDGPGMFGLSDPDTIRGVLSDGGWRNIEIADVRAPLLLGGGGPVEEVVDFFGSGMLRMVLGDVDDATRHAARDSLRAVLADHAQPDGVRLEGAVWLVTAGAPA